MKTLRHGMRHPAFVVGAFLFLTVVGFALVAPAFLGRDPLAQDFMPLLAPGQDGHSLGTDALGRDMLARLVYGTRSSLLVGALAGLLATLLGTMIGLFGGYKGGRWDHITTFATNLVLVIPQLVILVLLGSNLGHRSYALVALVIGLSSWPWVARAVGVQTASLRTREHVQMARLNGFGALEIVVKHILPYTLSYIFMAFVLQLTSGILSEAALSMLGLGPQSSGAVSLGLLLDEANRQNALEERLWWLFLPPTFLVTALAFSLFLVNSAMEEIFNPRLRR